MVNAAKEEPEKEIEAMAIAMYTEGISSIVVDTRMKCLSRGEAPKLAQKPGGRYFYRYKAIIS